MTNRCIIIGSGNSIRQGDYTTFSKDLPIWKLIKDEYTIGINWSKNYFDSTIQLYSDTDFWQTEKESLRNLPLVVTKQDAFYGRETKKMWKEVFRFENIYILPGNRNHKGVESWKLGFYTGKLSGIFSISLAIALGVKEIFLLGMDCKAIDGRTHFYQGDSGAGDIKVGPKRSTGVGFEVNGKYKTSVYDNPNVDENYIPFLKEDVKIYNVSPESKITVFPKITYEEFEEIITKNPNKINQDDEREKFINHHVNIYK